MWRAYPMNRSVRCPTVHLLDGLDVAHVCPFGIWLGGDDHQIDHDHILIVISDGQVKHTEFYKLGLTYLEEMQLI